MTNRSTKIVKLSLLLGLAAALGACGDQGYGPTHSYSARYGTNGTVADATANNGSTSTSVEAQRQKIRNANDY